MSEIRRLSAIVFTDMVGYTEGMARDEKNAMAMLHIQDAIVRQEVARTRGRVVKTIGDAFLLEFGSAVDAVECAMVIQRRLESRNLNEKSQQRILLRIGIHIGDVTVGEDGDLLGDGVNVAARLEPLAAPGGICISRAVFDAVKSRQAAMSSDWFARGFKGLKGISSKVEVFELGHRARLPASRIIFYVAVALMAICLGWHFRSRPLRSAAPLVAVKDDHGRWELLFEDDFSGAKLKSEWKVLDGKMNVTNGALEGEGLILSKFLIIDGCKVEVDITPISDSSLMSIFLNAGPSGGNYVFNFGKPTDLDTIGAWFGKPGVNFESWYGFDRQSTYHVECIYLNGWMTMIVDGDTVGEMLDPFPVAGIDHSLFVIRNGTYTGSLPYKITNLKIFRRGKPLDSSMDLAMRMLEKNQFREVSAVFDEIIGSDRSMDEKRKAQFYKAVSAFMSEDSSAKKEFEKVISTYPYDGYINSECEYYLILLLANSHDTAEILKRAGPFLNRYPESVRSENIISWAAYILMADSKYNDARHWLEERSAALLAETVPYDASNVFRNGRREPSGYLGPYATCGYHLLASGDTASALKIFRKILFLQSFGFDDARESIRHIEGDTPFTAPYATATRDREAITLRYDITRSPTLYVRNYKEPIKIKYGTDGWKSVATLDMKYDGSSWNSTFSPKGKFIDYVFLDGTGREIDKNNGLNFRAYLNR